MRLRDRFRKEGCDLDHFEPHNTLELLLFYCAPQKDTNELAHLLIDEFGSISGVFDASYEELIKVNGVGEYTATFLKILLLISIMENMQLVMPHLITPNFLTKTQNKHVKI